MWSGRTYHLISTIPGNSGPINCVAYHPLKEFIVTGSWEGNVAIWDLVKLERRALLHTGSVKGIRIHMYLCIYISKYKDIKSLKLILQNYSIMQRLNAFLGSSPEDSENSKHDLRSIQDVKFNSDASLIASCDLGGNVVLFDGQV